MGKTANIKFNGGIVNTPSDISPMDGDLNECINLVPSDGELKPVEMPVNTDITSPGGEYVLASIHNTANGNNFVFIDNTNMGIIIVNEQNNVIFRRQAFDIEIIVNEQNNVIFRRQAFDSSSNKTTSVAINDVINTVSTIGNTIILHGTKRMYYIKWKNNEYKWLGGNIPKPVFDFKMQFDLENDSESSSQKEKHYIIIKDPTPTTYELEDDEVSCLSLYADKMETYSYWHLSDKSKMNVVENLKSKIAKAQAIANEKGMFIHPFYVRYAVKLFDGTYIMHSSPLLMLPSTNKYPICASINWYRRHWNDNSTERYDLRDCNLYLIAKPSKLMYKFLGYMNSSNKQYDAPHSVTVDDWDDIIVGIDIFLSRQISSMEEGYYDDDYNVPTQFVNYKGIPDYITPKNFGKVYSEDSCYMLWDYFKPDSFIQKRIGKWLTYFPIKTKQETALNELIANEGIFYKAKSYSLDDLKQSRFQDYVYFDKECEYNTLDLLGTLPALQDDYINICNKGANVSTIYNKRVIISNVNIEAPLYYPVTEVSNMNSHRFVFTFVIEKNHKTIYVRTDAVVSRLRFGHYIYYPDADCKEVIVYYANYTPPGLPTVPLIKTLKMTRHNSLNGAYVMMPKLKSLYETLNLATDWNNAIYYHMPGELPPETSYDRYYRARNILFMSPVLNPFVFNVNDSIEIGNGSILGVATATIPMSEGQYGQYPIVVFTTQGISAIGINNDGTIDSIAPVSSADTLMGFPAIGRPNVISDGQSLYFITKRGLMELRGLQVRCVSEILNGRKWNSNDYRNSVVAEGLPGVQNCVSLLANEIADRQSFNQIVESGNAFLVFDYKHNRIIVTEPTRESHYMYSIGSGKWSKLVFGGAIDKLKLTDSNFMSSWQLANAMISRGMNDGKRIVSAVFDYDRSYVQIDDSSIYDIMGAPDENNDSEYKFGFLASRPIRLGTDDYKTLLRIMHRKRIDNTANKYSCAAMRLYGSVDGIRWYELRHLRGAAFKYYTVLVYTCMKANERYSYMSVEFDEKFQNRLR